MVTVMLRLILILLASAILTSCYSYKVFPKEYREFAYSGERQTAFIINPALKKENEILKESNIFTLTEDSSCENCLKIRLHPLKKHPACGQGIIVSAITAGQFPVTFPDRYQYGFDEIHPGDTLTRSFELLIAQRTWFWDMFVFHKKFNQKAGKTLLANYCTTTNSSLSAKK